MSTRTVMPTLDDLAQIGFFSPLEVHMARRLVAIVNENKDENDVEALLLGVALAARGPLHGQVCVNLESPPDLSTLVDEGECEEAASWGWPRPADWAALLRRSALVGDGSHLTPLVLDDALRLYLYRYFKYQQRLLDLLRRRSTELESSLDVEHLRQGLARLFGEQPDEGTRGQRRAAAMAICRRFSVISGGPGTGKTTTVLKIIALLQEQARATGGGFPRRVLLLAPTGKAAARLGDSIKRGKAGLDADEEILSSIPDEASTIHRTLGYRRRQPTRFAHDSIHPLSVDAIVVDESSMVDLALMTKLLEAVPLNAKVLLLGDRDQLASVEAGAILGDICNVGGGSTTWSTPFATRIDEVTGDRFAQSVEGERAPRNVPHIADCIVHLTRSFRFGDESGIGALSRAINRGDADATLAYLSTEDTEHPEQDRYDDLDWVVMDDDEAVDIRPERVLGRRLIDGYSPYLVLIHDPVAALKQLDRFRVICAHRRGRFGVVALNELVRAQLGHEGLISPRGEWYEGRPVMISRNDYQVGLFNGDVGLTVEDHETGQLRVHFLNANGRTTRSFHPARLPAHETAFALTVHKSQGSEFDDVLFLLPRQVSPIVSRELLYTGATRAKRRVTIVGSRAVIREAVNRRVQRASGIRAALWDERSPRHRR